MNDASGSDRPAPGRLALVQAFLNTPVEEPSPAELELGDTLRSEHARGGSQATLAARYRVDQQLVSAAIRERRLVGAPGMTLGSPASTSAWLAARGFLHEGMVVSAEDYQRLLALREGVLGLTIANNGERFEPAMTTRLNALAEGAPLTVSFTESGKAELLAAGSGITRFISTVLAAVYEAQQAGTWERLKACPADRCLHVFYDTSRNRTSTWCSMAVCGNRAKVRSYQDRRRVRLAI